MKFEQQNSESSSCWNMSNQITNLSAKSEIEQIAVLHKNFKCSVKGNKKNVWNWSQNRQNVTICVKC